MFRNLAKFVMRIIRTLTEIGRRFATILPPSPPNPRLPRQIPVWRYKAKPIILELDQPEQTEQDRINNHHITELQYGLELTSRGSQNDEDQNKNEEDILFHREKEFVFLRRIYAQAKAGCLLTPMQKRIFSHYLRQSQKPILSETEIKVIKECMVPRGPPLISKSYRQSTRLYKAKLMALYKRKAPWTPKPLLTDLQTHAKFLKRKTAVQKSRKEKRQNRQLKEEIEKEMSVQQSLADSQVIQLPAMEIEESISPIFQVITPPSSESQSRGEQKAEQNEISGMKNEFL